MAVELSSIIVDTYEGDTEDEKFHGAGLLLFKSGNAYTGMFANGFMEGSGVYKWADGVTYIGEFKKNRMTGSGEYQWTNGCSYQGNVRNGFRHGRGFCESTPMGSTYDGEWSDGKQCGKGTMTYREGAHHRYEGSWLDGKKHGQGVMCYASGNEYSGDWKENVKEGWGRMFWRDRHEEYEGEWKEGQPNGRGVYIWRTASTVRHRHPMHNRYDGTWLDGKRSGFGVFEYATGARYEGEWVNNIKHGPGIYVTEHGRRYNGLFQNDRMVVEFEKYRNDAPFVFAVSDMLPKDFDQIVEEQLININHAIMRYTSELRNIYETYSKYNHLPAQHPSHSMMTRLELWKLIKDCQLQKRNITLAQMDRAYAVTFQADDVFKCKYDYPHLATERFILYDFLEALVRISHLLNKGRENLSIYEKSVAAEFSHLLKHDIVPKARGGGGGPSATAAQSGPLYTKWRSESTIESVEAELKDEMEHEYFGALNSMYGDLCCPGLRSLAGSVGDQTMTLRDVIQKLMEYEVIDAEEKGPLTVKTLINIFSADLPAVQVDEDYNLDYEVVQNTPQTREL
ncbi:hypothetical protein BJ742DRAFT_117712 [Cladochytrium replicatum]|nr:hypothetical protein BJ742DRAFT_117712 [Cladochytrium replicatum]